MLVLSRHEGEKIIVRDPAGNVVVTITACEMKSSGRMRIGVEADQSWSIHREEVDDAVQAGEAVRSVGKHVADVLMDAIESGPELSDQ